MQEVLKFIFNVIIGFLGERSFEYLCKVLSKKNILWHVRTIFLITCKKLFISVLISIMAFFGWHYWREFIIQYVINNFYKWNVHFAYAILFTQCCFFFLITLFFLVFKEYVKEIEKKKQVTDTFALLVSGKKMRDAVNDLSEKISISECVLSVLLDKIPGAVILIDKLFNIALVNEKYRQFCTKHYITTGIGRSCFHTLKFYPEYRFQDHVINTFVDNKISEDVLLVLEKRKREIQFNVAFYPIKNGEVLMVMVIFKEINAGL